jgi:Fur family peroxide stress response transcriptional regulator
MNQQTTNQQATIDYLIHQLEDAGKRSTPQRAAICQALVEHGGHPTVADVFDRVRATFPMISLATVYNTIDTLQELGLIQRLDIANHDHTHYDLDLKPHINVVCRHCEYMADVYIDALDDLLTEVSERTGCDIDKHAGLIVYGVCPECQAAGKTSTAPTEPAACPMGHGQRQGQRQGRGRQRRRSRRSTHAGGNGHED